jgi:hypothetical protein
MSEEVRRRIIGKIAESNPQAFDRALKTAIKTQWTGYFDMLNLDAQRSKEISLRRDRHRAEHEDKKLYDLECEICRRQIRDRKIKFVIYGIPCPECGDTDTEYECDPGGKFGFFFCLHNTMHNDMAKDGFLNGKRLAWTPPTELHRIPYAAFSRSWHYPDET